MGDQVGLLEGKIGRDGICGTLGPMGFLTRLWRLWGRYRWIVERELDWS
jgi:hypothetical protein